jgi:uncharacterized protein YutE (UPF0331/DUF86 family)
MTDTELVLRKLATLQDHLQRARRRRPATIDALIADQDLQDALSMSLLVAIQEALDIAFHIAADEGWGIPGSYAESFDILARNGVLDGELAQAMASAAGLRNRIAHGYATLDLPRLWAELPSGFSVLERYAQALATFLGST